MFEDKPPQPPFANGSEGDDSARDELCALSWSELTAKLAAARDLRGELGNADDAAFASFDPHCAAHIASHSEKLPDDGKRDVNPDGLGNGKDRSASIAEQTDRDNPVNRGNT